MVSAVFVYEGISHSTIVNQYVRFNLTLMVIKSVHENEVTAIQFILINYRET
jgi:hypothetical protein